MPARQAYLTSFIGRDREVSELRDALKSARLLTVTGPGGIGKTRVVAEVLSGDPTAVFVGLDGTRDRAEIGAAIAAALGVHESESGALDVSIREHLRREPKRLVLDPCEHVAGAAAAMLQDLLRASHDLTAVVVSRQVLGIEGERVFRIGTLPIVDAVELLLDRGRLIDPQLGGPNEKPALELLSAKVDAIPLALELAAARLGVLGPNEIIARLTKRFELLRRGEQTLYATVDWSYTLLDDAERRSFRMLSIFRAPFDSEAAQYVAGVSLDSLQSLIEKSLVQTARSPSGDVRYQLLDAIRDYGALKLRESAEVEGAMRRLAEWMARFTREIYPPGKSFEEYFELLRANHDNLTGALEWAQSNDPSLLAPMAAFSWLYYYRAGRRAQGITWLEAGARVETLDRRVRLMGLMGLGTLLWQAGRPADARGKLEAAVELARRDGDQVLVARALANLAMCNWSLGERRDALKTWTDVMPTIRSKKEGQLTWPYNTSTGLYHMGSAMLSLGDDSGAQTTLNEALDIARTHRIDLREISALISLSELDRRRKRFASAQKRLRQAVHVSRREPSPILRRQLFETAAAVAADAGSHALALRLWGAAESAGIDGAEASPFFGAEQKSAVERASGGLGAAATRELEMGRNMSLDQAYDLVRVTIDNRSAGALTERQLEVARLIASGLTNRQIAEQLFITERGAEGHVERIGAKLGVNTRSAIAAWFKEMEYRD